MYQVGNLEEGRDGIKKEQTSRKRWKDWERQADLQT